jgi:deoxycytidine triphosphate deaminase
MILSGSAIRRRLDDGEIFARGSWDEGCIKEASYTLRVADDGMHIDGKAYPPGRRYPEKTIRIEPGSIGILSTVEKFKMPKDLVGHQGIRFDYAVQGLTGLMGIQVDPLYGANVDDERLYLRFANLSNAVVEVVPGEAVFNIEFQMVQGDVDREYLDKRHGQRQRTWDRIQVKIAGQPNPGWSYTTRVEEDLRAQVDRVEKIFQPVLMFGVFLVAATMLGVALAILLSIRTDNVGNIPHWVTNWMWALLLTTLSLSALAVTVIGAATALRFIGGEKKPGK